MILITEVDPVIKLPDFDWEEFECQCCGKVKMNSIFLWRLQQARFEARVPFQIDSGYRCEKHNKEVGGAEHSDHLYGEGVDILTLHSTIRWKIITSAISAGITRIGIGANFTHLGIHPTNPQLVMWTYPASRKTIKFEVK